MMKITQIKFQNHFQSKISFKLLLKTSDNQTFEDYKIYPTKYFRKAKRENRRINLFIYQK